MSTPKKPVEIYWSPVYETLYDAWFQELTSEALSQRWQFIDTLTKFLIAVTASGSAVAGWTLWTNEMGKYAWAVLAGLASVLSIVNGVIEVPDRLKQQQGLGNDYRKLRVDLETFRLNLLIGIDADKAESSWTSIRNQYEELMSRTPPDMLFTKGLSRNVESRLNDLLKTKGYTK